MASQSKVDVWKLGHNLFERESHELAIIGIEERHSAAWMTIAESAHIPN